MSIKFQILNPSNSSTIELIAQWYLAEWNILVETTIQKLSQFPTEGIPFQLLMTLDDLPIATGGLYYHVALLDREPKFKIYKHWLALVYTIPEHRGKGYGALLCEEIQNHSKTLSLKEVFLFTHTAESLYKRLGWQQLERIESNGKQVVIMSMPL